MMWTRVVETTAMPEVRGVSCTKCNLAGSKVSLSTMLRYFALERDSCVDFCVDILLERDNIVVYDFCNDFCLLIFTIDFRC